MKLLKEVAMDLKVVAMDLKVVTMDLMDKVHRRDQIMIPQMSLTNTVLMLVLYALMTYDPYAGLDEESANNTQCMLNPTPLGDGTFQTHGAFVGGLCPVMCRQCLIVICRDCCSPDYDSDVSLGSTPHNTGSDSNWPYQYLPYLAHDTFEYLKYSGSITTEC
jgi:hypothetical protein